GLGAMARFGADGGDYAALPGGSLAASTRPVAPGNRARPREGDERAGARSLGGPGTGDGARARGPVAPRRRGREDRAREPRIAGNDPAWSIPSRGAGGGV